MARVECDVETVDVWNEDTGRPQPGVQVTCRRCGDSAESFGQTERSMRRCLMLLKESCRDPGRGERGHYYELSDGAAPAQPVPTYPPRTYSRVGVVPPARPEPWKPVAQRLDPSTKFKDLPLLMLKLHTTGLSRAKADIVQVGLVEVRTAGVIGWRHLTNVRTAQEIPERATAIHGLTADILSGAATFAAIKPELQRLFANCVELGIPLFGWGIRRFDLHFLARERVLPHELQVLDLAELEKELYPDAEGHSFAAVLQRWTGSDDHHGDALRYLSALWGLYSTMIEAGLGEIEIAPWLRSMNEEERDET